MADKRQLVAEILRTNPNISDDDLVRTVRERQSVEAAAAPKPLDTAWEWANAPLVSPDFGQSLPGRAAATVTELATTPANLAGLGLGLGASAAGARGLLGISRGARIAEAALQAPLILEGAQIAGEGLQEGDPIRAAIGGGEAALGALGIRSAVNHSFPMDKVAAAYNRTRGLPAPVAQRDVLDPLRSRAIADAYEAMLHAPADPAVAGAYGALGSEVSDQFAFLRDRAGMRMEPWTAEGQPYANSAAMTADVRDNNHLWYFPTEGGYGDGGITDNPLLQPGRSGRPRNDEFRAVHDAFGHATRGHQFGPKGEDLAWQEHRQMFSPEATRALTTETRGQNSWVNFGPQMRGPDGALLKKGDPGWLGPTERGYAPQKTGLLPDWATEPEGVPPASAPAALDAPVPPSAAAATPTDLVPETAAAPSELLRFTHRSPISGLTELDPAAAHAAPSPMGSGAELRRRGEPGYPPRVYVTPENGFVEHRFRGLKDVYEGEVPKHQVYDLEADPDGFKARLAEQYPNGGPAFVTAMEAAVKDAGYRGYQADHAVALFDKVPVRPVGGATPSSAPSPTSAAVEPPADAITNRGLAGLLGAGAVVGAGQQVDDGKQGGWDDMVRAATAGAGLAAVGWFPKGLKAKLDLVKKQALELDPKAESAALNQVKRHLASLGETGQTPRSLRAFSPEEQTGLYKSVELPKQGGIDFDRRVPFAKTLVKHGTGVKFSKFTKQRMGALYQIGAQQPLDWGKPDWLGEIAGWDPEKTVVLARLLGSYSPQTPVNVNTAQALEAFLRIADGLDPGDELLSTALTVGKPKFHGAVRDNVERAAKGGRIFQDKTEALAGGELGSPNALPIDLHFLRAMGSATERTPGRGDYRLVAEAAMREAHELGIPLFPYMATVWTGIRELAGLAPTSFRGEAEKLGLAGLDLTNPKNRAYANSQLALVQKRLSVEGANTPLAARPAGPNTAPPADLEAWRQQVRELFDREHVKGPKGDVLGKKQAKPKKARTLADIAAEYATGTDELVPF